MRDINHIYIYHVSLFISRPYSVCTCMRMYMLNVETVSSIMFKVSSKTMPTNIYDLFTKAGPKHHDSRFSFSGTVQLSMHPSVIFLMVPSKSKLN